ncbi:hypothetical protein [Nonomuraea salmonea]|uniref:hypothetical protein n=1 Tax=Nonomuraea salmonea TaxID=46181 RepID=UPI002FEA3B51
MTRYGDEHAQRWASQPDNSPRTSPYTLLGDILSPRAREDAPDPTRQDWSDALRQVGPARRDLDGLETNILIRARAAGLTWREIADALGLDSPPKRPSSAPAGSAPPPTRHPTKPERYERCRSRTGPALRSTTAPSTSRPSAWPPRGSGSPTKTPDSRPGTTCPRRIRGPAWSPRSTTCAPTSSPASTTSSTTGTPPPPSEFALESVRRACNACTGLHGTTVVLEAARLLDDLAATAERHGHDLDIAIAGLASYAADTVTSRYDRPKPERSVDEVNALLRHLADAFTDAGLTTTACEVRAGVAVAPIPGVRAWGGRTVRQGSRCRSSWTAAGS